MPFYSEAGSPKEVGKRLNRMTWDAARSIARVSPFLLMFALASLGYSQSSAASPVEELAPGVISTGNGFTVTFSPDSNDAYFTARGPSSEGAKPPLHIYHSHFAQGAWQKAEKVAFSSAKWSDLDPFVTLEGDRMFFVSTRPAPGKDNPKPDMDIWFSDLKNGAWADPQWVGEVNSTGKEGSPSLDREKNLYFFSDRGREANQNCIYVAKWADGHITPPVKLPAEVNAGPSDTSPWITPDGKTLLFYSTRAGGYGQADLYASFLEDGRWSKALNLGTVVNSEEFEYNPSLSRDGKTLYFGRNGKIYQVPVSALKVPELNRHLF